MEPNYKHGVEITSVTRVLGGMVTSWLQREGWLVSKLADVCLFVALR